MICRARQPPVYCRRTMSFPALILVLMSAFVHAGWNLLGKRDDADEWYFCVTSTTGFLVILPFMVLWYPAVAAIPGLVWVHLAVTGLFQALYFIGLAGAYRGGELSLVYPVARAFPVLIVPVASVVLGTGSVPSVTALTGMAIVTAGLLVIPREAGAEAGARVITVSGRSSRGWLAFAFLAGIGTTGYSLVDDSAMALLRDLPGFAARPVRAPMVYGGLQALSTAAVLGVYRVFRHRSWNGIFPPPSISNIGAGVAILLAYGLVLGAYGFADNAGYVVAFRQISLPVGVVLGGLVLQERITVWRITGTGLIMIGLVLVGAG